MCVCGGGLEGTCVCVCNSEYFMVKERVNSDQRQMWSHPSKAEGIKNYSDKDLEIRGRRGGDISQDNV